MGKIDATSGPEAMGTPIPLSNDDTESLAPPKPISASESKPTLTSISKPTPFATERLIPHADSMKVISEIMGLLVSNVGMMQRLALVQTKLGELPGDMQKLNTGVAGLLKPIIGSPNLKGEQSLRDAAMRDASGSITAMADVFRAKAESWKVKGQQITSSAEATSQSITGLTSMLSNLLQMMNTIMASVTRG